MHFPKIITFLSLFTTISGSVFSSEEVSNASILELMESYKFVDSKDALDYRLALNPNDLKAHILKFGSDIGYFYQEHLPHYFVNHLNTKEIETYNAFNNITREILSDLNAIDTADIFTINNPTSASAYVSGDFNQILNVTANTSTLTTEYGSMLKIENLAYGKEYTLTGEARLIENGVYGDLAGISPAAIIGTGEKAIEIYDSYFVPFTYKLVISEGTLDEISFGVNSGAVNNGTITAEFSNLSLTEAPYFDTDIYNEEIEQFGTEFGQIFKYDEVNDIDLGTNVTTDNFLNLFKTKPSGSEYTFRSLLGDLISNLSYFESEEQVIFSSEETGYSSDIKVQYADALFLKSMLNILDAVLGILDQYDVSLSESDLEDLIFIHDHENHDLGNWGWEYVFTNYPHILETISSKINDQEDAKSQIIDALDDFSLSLELMSSRSELSPFEDFLIEIEDYQAVDEEQARIIKIKESLNGFVKSKDLLHFGSHNYDGGSTISLAPFVQPTPFDIKGIIQELSTTTDLETNLNSLKYYGLIDEHLPLNFSNQIMVFYDDNNQIIKTAMYDDSENYHFDFFDGDFYDNSGDILENYDERHWNITVSHHGENTGSWHAYKDESYRYVETYDDDYGYWYDHQYLPFEYRSGDFYYYSKNSDINQNGLPDFSELEFESGSDSLASNNLNYPQVLSKTYIDDANIPPLDPIEKISKMILLEEINFKFIDMMNNRFLGQFNPAGYTDNRQVIYELNDEQQTYIWPTSYFISNKNVINASTGFKYEYFRDEETVSVDEWGDNVWSNNNPESPLYKRTTSIRPIIDGHSGSKYTYNEGKIALYDVIYIRDEMMGEEQYPYLHYSYTYANQKPFLDYDSHSTPRWENGTDFSIKSGLDLEENESSQDTIYDNPQATIEEFYFAKVIDKELIFKTKNTGISITRYETISYNYNSYPVSTTSRTKIVTSRFALYPEYLDMDGDELDDGYGIVASISPTFETLPTQQEIDDAINFYNESNNIAENNTSNNDSDLDGVPDTLEDHWSSSTNASSSNPNDASLTIDFLTNNVYTQEEVIQQVQDLRLGSTMYEVNEGLAYFNITLQHSNDMNEWHNYGTYDIELTNDNDSNAQFYRFKMTE